MTVARVFVFACAFAVLTPRVGLAQQPAPPEQEQQEQPAEQPTYEETVVVTASKTEEKLVNAPATLTVISSQTITSSPSQSFADLMRAVPGVNITQVSARDINLTSRGATGTLATGQLALLDGRSIYLDFFGFVMWDFLPVNFDEIRQIEVIRGPASAVWGANALNGVVNVITKSPREIAGNSFTLGFGGFDRSVEGSDEDAGTLFYVNGTHAAAPNERWSYKISAGAYTQDALPRPTGTIPGTPGTQYPAFENQGTTQPKFDTRIDFDHPDGLTRWTFGGGVAGTEGIMHSGIGPFDINSGSLLGYAKVGYSRRALRVNFFTNILNGDATNLLARGPSGEFIPFEFKTNTYDADFGNAVTFAARHVVSYGGNFRYNSFDLSLAPAADSRTEGGFYIQDDIFLHDRLRLVVGGRVDGFSNLDGAVFSPRTALMIKPSVNQTFRVSYNRAYRAPSVINEFLQATILQEADLSRLAGPNFRRFVFPIRAEGNEEIGEQKLDAYEVGYTGVIANRATVSAAFYWNQIQDDINFAQIGSYTPTNPPQGTIPPFPPPLRPALAVIGLPCCYSYINLGSYQQRGLELGTDFAVTDMVNAFVNYSWQDEPDPDDPADAGELNVPPQHRVNAGLSFNAARFLGNLSVSYNDDAFWQDVLDARYHGTTDAYTLVNAGFGVKWADDRLRTTIKVVNLTNEDVQQHVFGDVLKRQVIGELKVKF
jgi:iron complex outermembrane receptor protein